jgi:hypothetical protein
MPEPSDLEIQRLGTGYELDGVPLDELTPEPPEPNRADSANFSPVSDDDDDSEYARDYFDDADRERIADPIAESQGRSDERWSEGIEDEANPVFAEQNDDVDDENSLPEMGPIDVIEVPTPEQLDPNSSDRYLSE